MSQDIVKETNLLIDIIEQDGAILESQIGLLQARLVRNHHELSNKDFHEYLDAVRKTIDERQLETIANPERPGSDLPKLFSYFKGISGCQNLYDCLNFINDEEHTEGNHKEWMERTNSAENKLRKLHRKYKDIPIKILESVTSVGHKYFETDDSKALYDHYLNYEKIEDIEFILELAGERGEVDAVKLSQSPLLRSIEKSVLINFIKSYSKKHDLEINGVEQLEETLANSEVKVAKVNVSIEPVVNNSDNDKANNEINKDILTPQSSFYDNKTYKLPHRTKLVLAFILIAVIISALKVNSCSSSDTNGTAMILPEDDSDKSTTNRIDSKGAIEVKNINKPDVKKDIATTQINEAIEIDVLSNDIDSSGSNLIIKGTSQPKNGVVKNKRTSVTYTPNKNYTGKDLFSYAVSNDKGGSATSSVVITVKATKKPPLIKSANAPLAKPDMATTEVNKSVEIKVLNNDIDPDGDTLSIVKTTIPNNGEVTINGDNIIYTPSYNFTGSDTFTYAVSDGKGRTSISSVKVMISMVSKKEIIESIDAVIEDLTARINFYQFSIIETEKSLALFESKKQLEYYKDQYEEEKIFIRDGLSAFNRDVNKKYIPKINKLKILYNKSKSETLNILKTKGPYEATILKHIQNDISPKGILHDIELLARKTSGGS